MKTAYFTGLRKIEIVEGHEPAIEAPDDVLLRIDRVGICGSDVHYYQDGRIGSQVLRYPATLGHECAGTVLAVGSAVRTLAPGQRVAIDPAIVCGRCDQCLAGRPNTCRRLRFMGCPGEAPGAVAERSVLPAACCFAIPESMSLDQATLVEPLSIGLHAVRLAGLAQGAKVAVLGAGPIGLSVLLSAKASGACTVFVSDLLDERLAAARRCGADATANARREDVAAVFAGQTGTVPIFGQGPGTVAQRWSASARKWDCPPSPNRSESQRLDCIFECCGDPACIDQAQEMLAPGGTLVLVGIPPSDRATFDPHRMRRAELTFKSVRRQRDCVAPVIRLMAEGRLSADPLVTHRFGLEEISAAFELVAGYRDGVIKALLLLSEARQGYPGGRVRSIMGAFATWRQPAWNFKTGWPW